MARRTALVIPATTQIHNYWSSGGTSTVNVNNLYGIEVMSGVGTGAALKTLLSVSGGGYVPVLTAYSGSAVPTHTVRCRVTVDGLVAFDATTDSIASTVGRGLAVTNSIPSGSASTFFPSGMPIRFNSSLIVEAASSQSGTDYVAIKYQLDRT